MRAGRFDRQISVDRPDIKGRQKILEVHAKDVVLSDGVQLQEVARMTSGFSGADLANTLNEAALLAARRKRLLYRCWRLKRQLKEPSQG